MHAQSRPPTWFWIVAGLLVVWNGIGIGFCLDQIQRGAASAMWEQTPYHQALYRSLPGWYNLAYAAATFGGLFGAAMLLLRRRWAATLFALSLAALILQFGYTFAMTDLIAHEGAAKVVPFPVFLAVVGAGSIWLAGLARRRGWIA